jgi:hypothetical protein
MRCGGSLAVTPHRRVGDILVDGRRWRRLHVRHVADLVVVLILVAQWCWAPVDALAMLKNKMQTFHQKTCTRTNLSWINIKVEDSPGRRAVHP